VAYHANAVPVKDNENKRTRNASVSANSPNCAKKLAYVFARVFSLVTRKFCEFGYPGSLWVWVVIKSTVIRFPI
jgi:hypothetical protein